MAPLSVALVWPMFVASLVVTVGGVTVEPPEQVAVNAKPALKTLPSEWKCKVSGPDVEVQFTVRLSPLYSANIVPDVEVPSYTRR